MAKIDPGLKRLARGLSVPRVPEPAAMIMVAPRLPSAAARPSATPSGKPNVMLELAGDAEPTELRRLGFRRRTRAGRVLTGEIAADAIAALEHVEGLKRAEAARPLLRELDAALPDANVIAVHNGPQPIKGKGTLIGIIDSGIDYQHRSFRDEKGRTRILAIWDQAGKATDHNHAPPGFGYGVEYKRRDIDAALRSAVPLERVPHEDLAPYHGTHVAGIAAGNGQPGDEGTGIVRLVGVAPEADLIVVANTRARRLDPGTLGDSADTLDAVAYILREAERVGRPVAINLSQGDNVGPHDGTSLLEVGIANLIDAAPGRVFVKSAGNEAETRHHVEGTLAAGQSVDIPFTVLQPPPTADALTELIIDVWSEDPLVIAVVPPGGGAQALECTAPSEVAASLPNGNHLFLDAETNDPGNGLARTYIALDRGSQDALEPGDWALRITGTGKWHGWIQRDSTVEFNTALATATTTISIPGTSPSVISVGSHVSKALTIPIGSRSRTSSCGPTRDGRPAPTLTAPGHEIEAPQPGTNDASGRVDHFVVHSGTSMAAPMVTGAAALMLSINPQLTATQIRGCLERGASSPGPLPADEFGAGRLDVASAIAQARQIAQPQPPPRLPVPTRAPRGPAGGRGRPAAGAAVAPPMSTAGTRRSSTARTT